MSALKGFAPDMIGAPVEIITTRGDKVTTAFGILEQYTENAENGHLNAWATLRGDSPDEVRLVHSDSTRPPASSEIKAHGSSEQSMLWLVAEELRQIRANQ